MITINSRRMNADEFLAMERPSLDKHELIDGIVRDRPSYNWLESELVTNAICAFGNAARKVRLPCYGSDLRIGLPVRGTGYFYPDLSIGSDQPQLEDEHQDILRNSLLLLEVTSDKTEAFDRGVKTEKYRTIPSLRAFVLISHRSPSVEVWKRTDSCEWSVTSARSLDDDIFIPVLEAKIALKNLYESVEFPDASSNTDETQPNQDPGLH